MNADSRRRASVYLVVLGTALVVAVVGVAGLMVVNIQQRLAGDESSFVEAQFCARSAVERGLLIVANDPDWRTNMTSGTWEADIMLGKCSYTVDGVDPVDDDLSNNSTDPLVVTGTGRVSEARYMLSVELASDDPPGMDCLLSSLYAMGDVHLMGRLASDAIVTAEGDLNYADQVNADVAAVGQVVDYGGSVSGEVTEGIEAKETPQESIVAEYLAMAAPISIYDLPVREIDAGAGSISFSGMHARATKEVDADLDAESEGQSGGGSSRTGYVLDGGLIGPGLNPYGGTSNEAGIYAIFCNGLNLVISNMRIVGTLIIVDAGEDSRISGAVNWEPARADLPAMIVVGSMLISIEDTLSEKDLKMNLNPPGFPYEGESDDDSKDKYPSIIKGLNYIVGEAVVTTASFEGALVVTGDVYVTETVKLSLDPSIINNPPPGFERTVTELVIQPGSWRRDVYDYDPDAVDVGTNGRGPRTTTEIEGDVTVTPTPLP